MTTEQSRPTQRKPNRLARLIPLLQWAPQYERRWLRPDLIAGLTGTALVVPKALGYAGIARRSDRIRSLRSSRRRDTVRALWDLTPDLDRAELRAGGRCR